MKYFKALGLAAMAATALLALAAGSASATVLCKTAVNPCPEGWNYPAGTVLDLSQEGTMVWEGGSEPTFTCVGSTIKGQIARRGSATETVSVALEAVQWFNCTSTIDTIELGELEIHWITGTNSGTITDRGTRWTVKAFTTDCLAGFSEWTSVGTITGGNPATVEINVVMPGFGCFFQERWTARYNVTQPTPLYVEGS